MIPFFKRHRPSPGVPPEHPVETAILAAITAAKLELLKAMAELDDDLQKLKDTVDAQAATIASLPDALAKVLADNGLNQASRDSIVKSLIAEVGGNTTALGAALAGAEPPAPPATDGAGSTDGATAS